MIEALSAILLLLSNPDSDLRRVFEYKMVQGENLIAYGKSNNAAQKLFRIMYILGKNSNEDFVRPEYSQDFKYKAHIQKNLISCLISFHFNPKLYASCQQIFRIVAQIIYATDNGKIYKHGEAVLYHLLCFVAYVLYMKVYEISKDALENDRLFVVGENEKKLLHQATGTGKKTLLKQVNSMIGGKGTSNLILFWFHNPIYLLKFGLPLATWSDRHDERALQQWLTVGAEVRSTALSCVSNHIVFSFRNFFGFVFVFKKKKKAV